MAEEGGFEPPVEFYPYDGLANRCLQPLGHSSRSGMECSSKIIPMSIIYGFELWDRRSSKTNPPDREPAVADFPETEDLHEHTRSGYGIFEDSRVFLGRQRQSASRGSRSGP